MGKIKFTDKVSTKLMTFLIDEQTLHTAYFTLIETVDGRKLTITDEESPSGMMEDDSRYKAIKKGKEFLEKLNSET